MTSSGAPIAFLVIILVAALLLGSIVSRAGRRRPRSRSSRPDRYATPTLNRAQMADRWATIQAMSTGGGNGLRQAVSEADKLLDQALRQAGVPGDTLGDRLKAAKPYVRSHDTYEGLWRAHKLRNALAHEVGFDLVPSQAKEALSDFERGLRELGAI
ncbi:MAG TPA: hypothetical protein VLF67_02750 [Candidatus Saccharimonas sp.]|nr:hypothetical protein [Candidatus Saccharimonas sp.]